jgi:hypothetical protein
MWSDCVKRRTMKLVLFLLAGAIINVAVAWGCAAYVQTFRFRGALAYQFKGATVISVVECGLGSARVRFSEEVQSETRIPDSVAYTFLVPLWMKSEWLEDDVIHDLRGWPCFAMTYEIKNVGTPQRHVYVSISGLSLSRTINLDALKSLPLTPIWPGFAINTIFYAAVLWVVFALPGKVRRWRRIKRGQCASCGYSLRGHDASGGEKCPECGRSTPSPSGRGRGEGEMKTR